MWRARVHEVLELARPGDRLSRVFDVFILGLIAVNVIAFVLQTERSIHDLSPGFFTVLEVASLWVFAVEYALRVWSCVEEPRFRAPVAGRLRFMATPLAVIDLLAILPLFVSLLGADWRFVRILRLTRIFRMAKLMRYLEAMHALGRVLMAKRTELLSVVFVLAILLVFASSLMYLAESDTEGTHFASIPSAMWWGIVTLTTVGYGDATPITPLGKLLAGVIAVLGIGMFALPTSILGAAFMDELQERRRLKTARRGGGGARCPTCGRPM